MSQANSMNRENQKRGGQPCRAGRFTRTTVAGTSWCLLLVCFLSGGPAAFADHSIARVWDEEILDAIRIDLPHPPVHARNLFHLSVCLYDAWAAFDPVAVGYLYHQKHASADVPAARREAISYAAYRILVERYSLSRNASNTLAALSARMATLGYPTDNQSLDPSTPAGLGNLVAATVSAYFIADGARQTNRYTDLPPEQGGYTPVNLALITGNSGTLATDVNCWQPLAITNAVSQNGLPDSAIQRFLGSQWLWVRPFALARTDSSRPWIDPGPQPRLNGDGDAQFRAEVLEVIHRSSELDPDDGVTLGISPGSWGNNSLGANDGSGHPVNPVSGAPYTSNAVLRADFARVLAEFWADGPGSETPPGHWNVLANQVSDDPSVVKRIGGTGPAVDDLEWDVKMYFALNAALHDAACAAWGVKRRYDGGRPIEFIRYMGQRGQSSEPLSPSFHPEGLPLVSNLIEVTTFASTRAGERHVGMPMGAVAVRTWPGEPANPATQHSGARWKLAADWLPYQKKTFVTPAFPGYISGHSTFSRAGAEVLAAMTGSPYFPGGMGTYTAPAGGFLTFEHGPSQTVQLQWGTYFDAADQAGLSRLWGGIHVSADDLGGRRIGSECGLGAWALARQYFDGSILNRPLTLTIRPLPGAACEIRYNTWRGFFYQLQYTTHLNSAFVDDPRGPVQATDIWSSQTDPAGGDCRFYRVVRIQNR